jgi:hypothetical protein
MKRPTIGDRLPEELAVIKPLQAIPKSLPDLIHLSSEQFNSAPRHTPLLVFRYTAIAGAIVDIEQIF